MILVRNEHSAATALNPFFRPVDLVTHMAAVVFVIDSFYHDEEPKRLMARSQMQDFALKTEVFSPERTCDLMWETSSHNSTLSFKQQLSMRAQTSRVAAVNWWMQYGSITPKLQAVAIALASSSAQAVSADRSFSIQSCCTQDRDHACVILLWICSSIVTSICALSKTFQPSLADKTSSTIIR